MKQYKIPEYLVDVDRGYEPVGWAEDLTNYNFSKEILNDTYPYVLSINNNGKLVGDR